MLALRLICTMTVGQAALALDLGLPDDLAARILADTDRIELPPPRALDTVPPPGACLHPPPINNPMRIAPVLRLSVRACLSALQSAIGEDYRIATVFTGAGRPAPRALLRVLEHPHAFGSTAFATGLLRCPAPGGSSPVG